MYRILSWVGTVLFGIAFAVTLLVFDVLLRISALFGLRAVERVGILLQVALVRCLPLVGTRVEIERSPLVADHTSYLIVSNHQSMFDVPLFGSAFRTHAPKFISKQSLGHGLPGISPHLRLAKHPLIDRSDRGSSVAAIQELGSRVAQGRASAVLFPEGTRSRAGRLMRFRRKGLEALLEAAPETPVVPVALENSWKIMRHDFLPIPWGIQLGMWIGDPMPRHPDEDCKALIDEIEARVRAGGARLRGETATPSADPGPPEPGQEGAPQRSARRVPDG